MADLAGADVTVIDKDSHLLKETFRTEACQVIEADLHREDMVGVADELTRNGPVELVVNNVGITTPHRFLEIGPPELDLVLGTNLRGPVAVHRPAGEGADRRPGAGPSTGRHGGAGRSCSSPRCTTGSSPVRRTTASARPAWPCCPGDGQGPRPAPDQGERDLTGLDQDRGGHRHPGAGGEARAAAAAPPARPACPPTSPGSPCSCSATPGRAMSPARTSPWTAGCPSTTGSTSSGPRSVSATRARPAYTSSQRLTGTAGQDGHRSQQPEHHPMAQAHRHLPVVGAVHRSSG